MDAQDKRLPVVALKGRNFTVETPFAHEGFLNDLRAMVPHQHMRWDGRKWHIRARYEMGLLALLHRHFGGYRL